MIKLLKKIKWEDTLCKYRNGRGGMIDTHSMQNTVLLVIKWVLKFIKSDPLNINSGHI